MEQATNQFTRGLQMDTHPMVLGNDTLTDCLNGTLITMSGDEVILQNDMGNRRVDLAFLPAGYEPIGMKEYGGIIYVVAYNPITNKSQIGSFPSPLRKYISSNDNDKEITLNLDKFDCYPFGSDSAGVNPNTIYAITSDSYLVKLIDEPLCPGDKFLTVIDDYDESNNELDNISNWDLYSELPNRKNKLYTLSYGILNSQNQFVDITKNLIRWDEDDIVANSGNTEINFNTGYFLPTSIPNVSWNGTLLDLELEEARLQLEMNTYSGKLVGYPYIKVKLNHPVSFNYSYKGKRVIGNGNTENLELIITGTIKFNCPISSSISNNNKSIFMLFENKTAGLTPSEYNDYIHNKIDITGPLSRRSGGISINQELYYRIFGPILLNVSESPEIIPSSSLDPNYDKISELFTITAIKKYTISGIKEQNSDKYKMFNGYLGVPVSDSGDYLNYYIVGDLILPISIDPNLFGSDTLVLDNFGWKKENGKLYIRYNLLNYLADDTVLSGLRIKFVDETTGASNTPFYETLNTDEIGVINYELNNLSLLNRHYYSIKFLYKINNNNTWIDEEHDCWILNTSLLNDCYSQTSDNYIKNYCNRTYKEEQIFKELTIIEYEDNSTYGSPISNETRQEIDLSLFWKTNKSVFDILLEHNVLSDITITKNFKIKNEENYPADINNATADIIIKNENGLCINENEIVKYITGGAKNNIDINQLRKNIVTDITTVTENLLDYIRLNTKFNDFFISNQTGVTENVTASQCLHSTSIIVDEMVNENYIDKNFGPIIHVNKGSGTDLNKLCVTMYGDTIRNSNFNWNTTVTNDKFIITDTVLLNKLIGYRLYSDPVYPSINSMDYPHGSSGHEEDVSNVCAYCTSSNNSPQYHDDDSTYNLVNNAYKSYIYLRGESDILVLSEYKKSDNNNALTWFRSLDSIKDTLLQYFGGNKTRVYIDSLINFEAYTVHGAKQYAVYTCIDSNINVEVVIGYSNFSHSYSYVENNNNRRTGCYFTSSLLLDNVKYFTIPIKSNDDFLNYIEFQNIEVSKKDLLTMRSINNSGMSDRHLFIYNGSDYIEPQENNSNVFGYILYNNKCFPTLKRDENKKTFCYLYGTYNGQNSPRHFYASFEDAYIYTALKPSFDL